jgi:hypothetical protein
MRLCVTWNQMYGRFEVLLPKVLLLLLPPLLLLLLLQPACCH